MTKLFLAAAFVALPAFASPILDPAPSAHVAGPYQPVHEGHDHVHGTGTVNSVDEAGRKINLSHGPIPQVGWPAMTICWCPPPLWRATAPCSGRMPAPAA